MKVLREYSLITSTKKSSLLLISEINYLNLPGPWVKPGVQLGYFQILNKFPVEGISEEHQQWMISGTLIAIGHGSLLVAPRKRGKKGGLGCKIESHTNQLWWSKGELEDWFVVLMGGLKNRII